MRFVILRSLLLLLFLAITVRLFYWQVVRAPELQARAEGQHLEKVKIEAERGKIFFADGSSAASIKPSFILYGLPKVLNNEEKQKTASLLSQIISQFNQLEDFEKLKADFRSQLAQDLYWVILKKNIDLNIKKTIEEAKIKGTGFDPATLRFYPEGSSSAHLLGFVGSDTKGESTGYFGLEGYYNGELKGISGVVKQEKDALGLPILIGKFLQTSPRNGKNLVLNIDRTAQYIVEQAIRKGQEHFGAKSVSAVIMDPKTGAILALASYPSYDPADFLKFSKDYYKNPIVAETYEPGSTFKVLVMATAFNEGVVKPDTRCDMCSGSLQIADFKIKTWNDKYYPDTTMVETIIHSDNTGMVFAGKKLGIDSLFNYLENFGFGKGTNIDLQDEQAIPLRPKKNWREIDLATASFGQGIAVTPIQMITAVSTIANGGYLMEPHVVKEIKDEKGSFEIKPKIVRKVLKEETTKTITEMMVKAVNEGEAKWAKPKGFKIAGKTGTAQIPVAGHYDPEKTIASFVGFAPADDPKFVMLVLYNQPSSSIFGSETAAPTFFEIAKELFTYYKIAPSE